MPSFFKKIILGKKHSNPYLNQYHPDHKSTCTPGQAKNSPTYPQPPKHSPTYPLRPVSPTVSSNLLAEARQAAGRDPVTGRPTQHQFSTYAAASGSTISPTGHGNPQPRVRISAPTKTNPYLHTTGNATPPSTQPPNQTTAAPHGESGHINHAGIFVQKSTPGAKKCAPPAMGSRYEIAAQEARRRTEEDHRMRAPVVVGGREFYAPERPGIREFYAGGVRD
jgi:hypothetical protein